MNESEKRERITANWKQVQSDVAQAAKQAGREKDSVSVIGVTKYVDCLLYTSPSPRDLSTSRMPSSA